MNILPNLKQFVASTLGQSAPPHCDSGGNGWNILSASLLACHTHATWSNIVALSIVVAVAVIVIVAVVIALALLYERHSRKTLCTSCWYLNVSCFLMRARFLTTSSNNLVLNAWALHAVFMLCLALALSVYLSLSVFVFDLSYATDFRNCFELHRLLVKLSVVSFVFRSSGKQKAHAAYRLCTHTHTQWYMRGNV